MCLDTCNCFSVCVSASRAEQFRSNTDAANTEAISEQRTLCFILLLCPEGGVITSLNPSSTIYSLYFIADNKASLWDRLPCHAFLILVILTWDFVFEIRLMSLLPF